MPIENQVAKLEQERREREWLRVMHKYPQVSAYEMEKLLATHLFFATWTPQQLEAYAATGTRPDGVIFPEGI